MKRTRNDSHFRTQRPPARLSTPLRLGAAAVAACFITGQAVANPTAPTVVNGSASFNQAGNVLTVTNSNGAAINWNTFSIASGETTHFVQPSASSQVLNRVLGNDPSLIYGTLSSNGRVWLVNPAGILVGPGGRIDVAGFVASTLNISNADFLAGKLDFNAAPGAGNVVNQGEITTPAGGNVYLVGVNVTNEGIITTPQGETILAAGQTVSLIDTATPGVRVDITGAAGNATNLGQIVADAGRIGIAGVIVRNSGTLNASSAVAEGGRIFLKASQDAYVDGNGRIITTGTKGGRVEVLGNRVAVMDNAEIDASGQNGGGTILVGGDYQGKNPDIQNASITYFGPNATLKADAQNLGAGGTVIVWANDTTRAFGTISARGGANGGNGGFVETSGKNYLAVDGIRVDTRAPNGTTGNWLLDPDELTLLNGSGVDVGIYGGPVFTTTSTSSIIYGGGIQTALGTTNVTLQTGGGGGDGNITASGVTISNGTAAYGLTLAAYGGGSATGNINISNSSFSVYGGVTLLAGWDGSGYLSSNVISGKGDIAISGSLIQSDGGGINLWAGHDIALSSSGTVGSWVQGTAMDVFAGHDLTLTGGSTASGPQGPGVMLYSTGTQTVYAGNQILLTAGSANNTAYAGDPFYGGSVGIEADGDQTITAATIKLAAGTAGHDNAAGIHGSGNSQTINVTTLLDLKGGGGGTNNFASIHATGAFGTGNQTINVAGGSIVLTGGASGGALNFENGAEIGLSDSNTLGSQTVYAGSITINGGGNASAFGGAGFGSGNGNNPTFTVSGDLTMNGGAGNNADFRATPAYIGSEYGGGTINVNVGGSINLNGGSGTAGGVLIGALNGDTCNPPDGCSGPTSITLIAGNNITATGNTGGVWLGVKNLAYSSGSSVYLYAGNSGYGGNIALNGLVGIQTDDLSGSIDMLAQGDGSGAYGDIVQTGGPGLITGTQVDIYADGNVDLSGTVRSAYGGYISLTSGDEGTYSGKHISAQLLQANGNNVNLYATGPIFANTQNAGSIYAETDYYNTPSGGIVINNTGAAQPSYVNLYDSASANSAVTFTHTGSDLTLDYNYYFYANGGPVFVAAPSNNLTYLGAGEGGLYGDSVILAAGNNLNIDSSLYNYSGDLGLVAGNSLNINSSVYSSNTLALAAPTINVSMSSYVSGYGGISFIAGNLNMTGGSCLHTYGDIVGLAAGSITLDNASFMEAGNDIHLALAGAASQLSLSNGSYLLADTNMAPGTIYLDFLGRSSGGIFLDGAATTAVTGASGSGFYEVNYGNPAVLDSTLFVTYKARSANEQILAILDSNLNRSTVGPGNETDDERARRLRDADKTEDGEHHDQSSKPVAQCS